MALTILFLLATGISNAYASCEIETSNPDDHVTSPGYPSDYPDNVDWCANLTAPPGYEIKLTMNDFKLQISQFCILDSLTFYDASSADPDYFIGTFCGTSIPSQFQSTSRSLFLQLKSDDRVGRRGFNASFEFIDFSCNQQHKNPGTISSPNYGNNYPNNVECEYRIKAPKGKNVKMIMQDFEVQPGPDWEDYSISSHASYFDFIDCPWDYLSVYNGPEADESRLIGVYCGNLDDVPEVIRSAGRQLYLKFKTDHVINVRGFQASFTFVYNDYVWDDAWIYLVIIVVCLVVLGFIYAVLNGKGIEFCLGVLACILSLCSSEES